MKSASPVLPQDSDDDDSSDLNTDEECTAQDATKNFQRNKVYIVQLINNAVNSETDATDRLVAFHYMTDMNEFKRVSMRSLDVLIQRIGEDLYDRIRQEANNQFIVRKERGFYGLQNMDLYKFAMSYNGLTSFSFYEFVVWPEMVTKWKMDQENLSYRAAEIELFGSRPFHRFVLVKVSTQYHNSMPQ